MQAAYKIHIAWKLGVLMTGQCNFKFFAETNQSVQIRLKIYNRFPAHILSI